MLSVYILRMTDKIAEEVETETVKTPTQPSEGDEQLAQKEQQGIIETNFHCGSEWHLSRLDSRAAALVHPFALRISKGSKRFAASATSVAQFFGLHRTTILRAYHELNELGFFELLEYGMFDTNIYRVLNHTEWAKEHPGLCTMKAEFPWTGEGDPLGPRLFAASGCRVKFKEFQIREYRETGLPEDTIVRHFEEFRSGTGKFRRARNVPYYFLMHLRQLCRVEVSTVQ